LVFYEFSGFPAKMVRPISSERNDIDGWFFLPQIQLFKLYKVRYLSVDSETLVFFWGETPWNTPTGITTFFAITQEGVDQSFSSSNSTEISIRRFYVRNFITIGLTFEELFPLLKGGLCVEQILQKKRVDVRVFVCPCVRVFVRSCSWGYCMNKYW
jgi:hypothetical protein